MTASMRTSKVCLVLFDVLLLGPTGSVRLMESVEEGIHLFVCIARDFVGKGTVSQKGAR